MAVGLGIVLWMVATGAQQGASAGPPPSTMEMTIVGTSLRASDGKIYVNDVCEIFPGLTLPLTDHKPKGEWNPDVCHIENAEHSERTEEKAAGGELERATVEIREQEYVLQNLDVKPALFELVARVPEGWSIDSDPRPARMTGQLAIFEIHAGPWEMVRLHVGIRHTKDLKPKALPSREPGGR